MKIYNEYLKVGKQSLAVQYLKQDKKLKQENTIVLLHEGLGSIEMWKDWPSKLIDSVKINLVVYSRLGMGQSSKEEKKKDIDFMTEEALYYLPKIINNYIIGTNSLDEINELHKINNNKMINSKISFKKFIINDNIILDPRKWPKSIRKS